MTTDPRKMGQWMRDRGRPKPPSGRRIIPVEEPESDPGEMDQWMRDLPSRDQWTDEQVAARFFGRT